jgi:hypothetical protein
MTQDEKNTEAKNFLQKRKSDYCQVFNPENQTVRAVLEDLKQFCRAESSTFNPDPRVHALLEGRREVYLRIKEHVLQDLETLFHKYKGERQ